MTEEERATEQRFVFPHDRHRHRVTRALVRSVLAEELGLPPSEIRFELNGYGRPELAAHHTSSGLSFNLSHTRDAIVLATSRDGVVGIDVEDHTRSGATLDIAEQFFSRPEVEALAAVAPEGQRARFYQVWTLKEAYIKARGMGLSL